ncbi:hypothetical protein O2K51_14095 [Apibacter raozihei]|uniref:hypothetical protein n=1 Tax=Apibacter TaxID=1778601 RepID=UPI000FE3BEC6|nr:MULTISPECIES: hypothetical protein [Apibacter]
MRHKNILFILFIFLSFSYVFGQSVSKKENESNVKKISQDTLITKVVDCNALFTLNNRKVDFLRKKPYVYTEPYYKMDYKSKKNFAVFQVGKRKGTTPFLYIKIFTFNTCIKKDEVVELIMDNGFRYRLKNDFSPNCDGFIISTLKNKIIKKLEQGNITSIKIFTFEKDYEFHMNDEDSERFRDELQCLKYNKFKFN